jgi:hypothetical protein
MFTSSSISDSAVLINRLTEVLRKREVHNPTPLKRPVTTLPSNTIQKMIMAILIHVDEIVGSSLIKNNPNDIDAHVSGLSHMFVDVHTKIMESLSNIDYGSCRMQSTIENTNIMYSREDCRYIITITLYYESGVEKEIMIDLTDGDFAPPVYITNTLKAEKMHVVLSSPALSKHDQKNMFTTLLVSCDNGRPMSTLERVMELQRADRSEVNPQSVLFGHDIVASLKAIRRINDTNNKKKFSGGVDFKETITITVSKENLCDPDWCSCNQGPGNIYQHGSIEKTFITLQCCGTTVCADLLTNNLRATYKAQFCPFSGPEGPHFMQFMNNSLLKPKDLNLMTRLNRYWESTEKESEILAAREKEKQDKKKKKRDEQEKNRDTNVGPHGNGCSCPWPKRNTMSSLKPIYTDINYELAVPILEDNFEDYLSDCSIPEIEWEEGEEGEKNKKEEKLNTVFIPVTHTRTMLPHCNIPGCKECLYKMVCFQKWASSLLVKPGPPSYNVAMPLLDHVSLNL